VFFPDLDGVAGTPASMTTFAVAWIARPFGAFSRPLRRQDRPRAHAGFQPAEERLATRWASVMSGQAATWICSRRAWLVGSRVASAPGESTLIRTVLDHTPSQGTALSPASSLDQQPYGIDRKIEKGRTARVSPHLTLPQFESANHIETGHAGPLPPPQPRLIVVDSSWRQHGCSELGSTEQSRQAIY
jgi:hypothetical protein